MSTNDLLNEVCKLPPDERLKFAKSVLGTIVEDAGDDELTAEQIKEIEARIIAIEADPSICIPWEEVKARARAPKS